MHIIETTLGQLIHQLVKDYEARYGDRDLAVIATESRLNDYFFESACPPSPAAVLCVPALSRAPAIVSP